jgi:phage terminase large subunit-like protein
MASRKPTVSADDLVSQMVTGLRVAAIRPNLLSYRPHDKQQVFHRGTTKGRLYIGGNRSGKTTGGVVEDLWRLTGRHPHTREHVAIPERPIRGRVVGVDFVNGIEKILLPEFSRWVPSSDLINGSWEDSYDKKLRVLNFANKSSVEFMSYDQEVDKFAGTSRDFVHFDEEPPEAIYDECIARLIDTGGPWYMTMTPVEGMTWIYDRIYLPGTEGKAKHIQIIEAAMEENPHLNKAEVELYLSGLDPAERRARGEGKFVQIGGLVFKTFNPQVHVSYDGNPHHIPLEVLRGRDWKWYCSLDSGFNNPTAVLWHAVNRDNQVVTFAEHYEREWTVEQHAAAIHERNAAHGRVPDLYVCDPALQQRNVHTGTTTIFEYQRLGLPFVASNNDVAAGISRMNEYLRYRNDAKGNDAPHWVIHGNCMYLIKEMARLRWKTYASKRIGSQLNRQDAIHKKDDHAPDSARYFFIALPSLAQDETLNRTDKSWHGLFSGSPGGTHVAAPRIDEGLAREINQIKAGIDPRKTEWTVVDEYMGGLF